MRTDIAVDFDTGDLTLSQKPPMYTADFSWEKEDDYYLYGRCSLNMELDRDELEKGIGVFISDNLKYKRMKVSFWAIDGSNNEYPIKNTSNNDIYYPVLSVNNKELYASELTSISDKFSYCFHLTDNTVYIADMYSYDFKMCESLEQNEAFLLKCYAGNLYQFPTTGIGLPQFLNGNVEQTELGAVIKKEFNNDNMVVDLVTFDQETKNISIKAREKQQGKEVLNG